MADGHRLAVDFWMVLRPSILLLILRLPVYLLE